MAQATDDTKPDKKKKKKHSKKEASRLRFVHGRLMCSGLRHAN